MASSAGAIVAELIDDRKLKSDIGRSVVHFLLVGQFLGFSGSFGPSHVTCSVCIFVSEFPYETKALQCLKSAVPTRFGSIGEAAGAGFGAGCEC